MSFLTSRTTLLARQRLATTSLHTTPTLTRAAFTTTTPHAKSALDTATDALHTVDRKVSDKLVDGIDIGTTVASKLKSAASDVAAGKVPGRGAEELKSKARGVKEEVEGRVREVKGEVQGKATEAKGEVEGKAGELAGEAKGKAGEVAGKARGVKEEVEGRVKRGLS